MDILAILLFFNFILAIFVCRENMINGNLDYLAMLMITGIIYFTIVLSGEFASDENIMIYYGAYLIFVIMQIFVYFKSTRR
ncbi:hypothetical protein UMC2_33731 [[Clostridium] sordellii]|uniref:hypothetical protein n=1 Tax=Paraclostridium sordellii TaxID=1505 RepID=UPI0005433238|nr:hypothetical protein [Paeniclostridium sordellii]CEK36503.1 hypothetical protein UMC2_33731 [[Clostridium] sordellii] [Paeniclostridium sordellii]